MRCEYTSLICSRYRCLVGEFVGFAFAFAFAYSNSFRRSPISASGRLAAVGSSVGYSVGLGVEGVANDATGARVVAFVVFPLDV